MRIALDVESVLADTNEAAFQSTEKLDRQEVNKNWNFSKKQWQIYMGVTDAVWRHKPEIIPPEEPMLREYVAEMRKDHEVHILTARQHVDEQMIWWLDHHGIEYDSFESTDRDKWTYDYDVFIDDNPEMFNECRLFLRHQPWNRHLDCENSKSVDRIYSVQEVLQFL